MRIMEIENFSILEIEGSAPFAGLELTRGFSPQRHLFDGQGPPGHSQGAACHRKWPARPEAQVTVADRL